MKSLDKRLRRLEAAIGRKNEVPVVITSGDETDEQIAERYGVTVADIRADGTVWIIDSIPPRD